MRMHAETWKGASSSQNTILVAVKSTKTNNPCSLRGLLSEIKILSYLGKHENIVSLVGVHRENLRQGVEKRTLKN